MENKELIITQPQNALNMFSSGESFNTVFTMAKTLSASTIIPDTFKGNVGNVMIAIDMSQRMNANPLMIMQNIYIVHGNPAWSAKFLVACINASGRFATPLRYEFSGKEGTDDYGCYAYAIDKSGEVLKGSKITIGIAKKSGWFAKNGSRWQIEPEQMLRYRAATRFQTAYCPEISCGLPTVEELTEGVDYVKIPSSVEESSNSTQVTQSVDIDNMDNKKGNDATEPKGDKPTQPGDNVDSGSKPMEKQPTPSLFQ